MVPKCFDSTFFPLTLIHRFYSCMRNLSKTLLCPDHPTFHRRTAFNSPLTDRIKSTSCVPLSSGVSNLVIPQTCFSWALHRQPSPQTLPFPPSPLAPLPTPRPLLHPPPAYALAVSLQVKTDFKP